MRVSGVRFPPGAPVLFRASRLCSSPSSHYSLFPISLPSIRPIAFFTLLALPLLTAEGRDPGEMGIPCRQREAVLYRCRCNPKIVVRQKQMSPPQIVPGLPIDVGGRRINGKDRHAGGKRPNISNGIVGAGGRAISSCIQFAQRHTWYEQRSCLGDAGADSGIAPQRKNQDAGIERIDATRTRSSYWGQARRGVHPGLSSRSQCALAPTLLPLLTTQ